MSNLQHERRLIAIAEQTIRDLLCQTSPGQAATDILTAYNKLSSDAEKEAFVAVLSTRLATSAFLNS